LSQPQRDHQERPRSQASVLKLAALSAQRASSTATWHHSPRIDRQAVAPTNLHRRQAVGPPRSGFVQEPVPERPQRLAV